MNKKIFTLLASALMLFSTAFTVNAKIIGGNLAVGDTVRTLPGGLSKGMYHLRIDSIYDGLAAGGARYVAASQAGFRSISNNSLTDSIRDEEIVVVGVKEDGTVIPISLTNLRTFPNSYLKADYIDLQTTMWCTDIEDGPIWGQWPTFRFKNKALGEDLDYKEGTHYIGNVSDGWVFSNSYDDGQLNYGMNIWRKSTTSGKSIALVYDRLNGWLESLEVDDDDLTYELVDGLLKFTIVEVAPVVLDAKAFNTKLGQHATDQLITLAFSPDPKNDSYPNYFGKPLKAVTATTDDGLHADEQYLNVLLGGIAGNYIYNIVDDGEENDARYINALGDKHIQILGDGKYDKEAGYHNKAYRFVYFPSTDSMVINALILGHHNQNGYYADDLYYDAVALGVPGAAYKMDPTNTKPFFYGLYDEMIHDALIVRRQDLSFSNTESVMVIGRHPANTRISFGINGCEEIEINAWTPDEGLYTIWDEEGRCLGVRIENGSISPQWMKLEDIEGECPDRIPSYQWIITKSLGRHNNFRVNISNREFGDNLFNNLVNIERVLIKSISSKIFSSKGQFYYDPISTNTGDKYVPIRHGWVTGRYIEPVGVTDCTVEGIPSGFRPVNKDYAANQYLGYKHFYVDTDPTSISYGKSDDMVSVDGRDMTEKGMDYNAFAFNYYHQYSDKFYIDMKTNYNDTMLHVNPNGGKEGFQFMLGTDIRANKYETEKYGYLHQDETYNIGLASGNYKQEVPVLERYYYEMKVADFYGYRDGLREEFVILKGAFGGDLDINNKLKYGVADTLAQVQPFKYANVYLRETYFIPKTKKLNEERSYLDPSRRIYYAIMDRIEEAQLARVTANGLEVSDTLMSMDASSRRFNLVMWRVNENTELIHAQGKAGSSIRWSTFALENMNYPLYRRLCSIEDDGATNDGGGLESMPYDAPKTLRFYTQLFDREYLYEDALSAVSANRGGINFLGLANADQYSEDKVYPDGLKKFNYNMFVDTAYINRGTGWIKPQYLLAVDVEVVDDLEGEEVLDLCGDPIPNPLRGYTVGRYLVNATDSAREIGSNGANGYPVRDDRYLLAPSWDRLIFVEAIHADDRLYILGRIKHLEDTYMAVTKEGRKIFNVDMLAALVNSGDIVARRPQYSGMLGDYYDFEEWQNYHNDVSFSLRFTNKEAKNASEFTGEGGSKNEIKSFRIESETTNRNPYGNRKIAPVQGGWVKIDNGAAVLSRTAYKDAIEQSEIFNVEKPTGIATDNGGFDTPSEVTVIAGIGEISVLNANGKNLTITNAIGQTLVTKVLDSDNVTVKCSKGIVFVSVLGEKTVKSIVK